MQDTMQYTTQISCEYKNINALATYVCNLYETKNIADNMLLALNALIQRNSLTDQSEGPVEQFVG